MFNYLNEFFKSDLSSNVTVVCIVVDVLCIVATAWLTRLIYIKFFYKKYLDKIKELESDVEKLKKVEIQYKHLKDEVQRRNDILYFSCKDEFHDKALDEFTK